MLYFLSSGNNTCCMKVSIVITYARLVIQLAMGVVWLMYPLGHMNFDPGETSLKCNAQEISSVYDKKIDPIEEPRIQLARRRWPVSPLAIPRSQIMSWNDFFFLQQLAKTTVLGGWVERDTEPENNNTSITNSKNRSTRNKHESNIAGWFELWSPTLSHGRDESFHCRKGTSTPVFKCVISEEYTRTDYTNFGTIWKRAMPELQRTVETLKPARIGASGRAPLALSTNGLTQGNSSRPQNRNDQPTQSIMS